MYLSGINIRQKGNKWVGIESLLKLMYSFVLVNFFKLIGVSGCDYIFCVILNWVWVNKLNNFILINLDVILYCIEDLFRK